MPLPLVDVVGNTWRASQCSMNFPSLSRRQMSMPGVPLVVGTGRSFLSAHIGVLAVCADKNRLVGRPNPSDVRHASRPTVSDGSRRG